MAAENLLQEENFANAGESGAAWQVVTGEGSLVEAAQAADGETNALHLKAAQVSQTVNLLAGLFELTVEAKGKGEIILKVESAGSRAQSLGADWGTYGYLFPTTGGETTVALSLTVEGTLTAARLQPATDEQQAAWGRAQAQLTQFGFFAISPQRPTPGSEPLSFEGEVQLLEAMTRRAVLDEPRMDQSAQVHNLERLVTWLGDNGFERLNGDEIADWMRARIEEGDAYGSVVLLCRGLTPATIMRGPADEPLWLAYLRAGGRLVNAGDLPFYQVQEPSVKPLSLLQPYHRGMRLLGLRVGWGSPYWGQGNLKVTPNPAAADWGFEVGGMALLLALQWRVFRWLSASIPFPRRVPKGPPRGSRTCVRIGPGAA